MEEVQWTRIRELFLGALELPQEERERFVEQETSAPELAAVRERALAMLRAHDGGVDPLPSWSSADAAGAAFLDPERAPSARVGAYRLVRFLASGSTSIVYEAVHEELARRVALKILRLPLPRESLRRKLQHEARTLARLEHPSIARIYEAGILPFPLGGGLVSELPYVALELVDGGDLLSFARERALGLRERIRLFAEVCAAVSYAHGQGVVHCDLKPGNILVSPSGVPKVLDFGLARLHQEDGGTQGWTSAFGQWSGTLPYMAPERFDPCSGGPETQSDVYSLGVVLHELVADRRPIELEGVPFAEAAQRIATAEVLAPSAWRKDLHGDLETILFCALERDLVRRYASVDALGKDLDRFLRGEPIAARPSSALYLFRRWMRRRRMVLAALVAIALASTAATLISLRFAWIAGEARDAALEAREQQASSRHEAERVASLLGEILFSPDLRNQDVDFSPIFDHAERLLADRQASSPATRALLHHLLGQALMRTEAFPQAEVHLRQALDQCNASEEPHRSAEAILATQAELYADWGRIPECRVALHAILEPRRRNEGGVSAPLPLHTVKGLIWHYLPESPEARLAYSELRAASGLDCSPERIDPLAPFDVREVWCERFGGTALAPEWRAVTEGAARWEQACGPRGWETRSATFDAVPNLEQQTAKPLEVALVLTRAIGALRDFRVEADLAWESGGRDEESAACAMQVLQVLLADTEGRPFASAGVQDAWIETTGRLIARDLKEQRCSRGARGSLPPSGSARVVFQRREYSLVVLWDGELVFAATVGNPLGALLLRVEAYHWVDAQRRSHFGGVRVERLSVFARVS